MKKANHPNLSNITQEWVDILAPFSDNYSSKLSASELARRSKIPQQTASRRLNALARLNLINHSKEGRNKLFHLDLEKQVTKIIFNLIEHQKALQFQLKAKEIALIVNEVLNFCESLIVFGSYAAGTFTKESDLDLVVLGKFNKKQIKRIKQKQIIEINEHYTPYNKFAKILKSRNPLSIEITGNHILFGDVSEIVDIFWRRAYEHR
jgi:predicted nucleotidyltransferase